MNTHTPLRLKDVVPGLITAATFFAALPMAHAQAPAGAIVVPAENPLQKQMEQEKKKREAAEADAQKERARREQAERNWAEANERARQVEAKLAAANERIARLNNETAALEAKLAVQQRGATSTSGNAPSVTTPRAQVKGDLSVRLRGDAIKPTVRELALTRGGRSAVVAFNIDNLSGEDVGLRIVDRSLLLGSCQPQGWQYWHGLSNYAGKPAPADPTLRLVRQGEKIVTSIEIDIDHSTCESLRTSTQTDISLQLFVSDGKQVIVFPLTFNAPIKHLQR